MFTLNRYLPNLDVLGVYAGVFLTLGTSIIEVYIYAKYFSMLESMFDNPVKKDRLIRNAQVTLTVTLIADIVLLSLNIALSIGTIFWRPFVYSVRLSSIVYFAMVIKELY